MTKLSREGLVVARMAGSRLFLAGASGSKPSFEGPSERTIFFRPESAERELRGYGVDLAHVELKPARLEMSIG